jgi:hypothetical protein
VNDPLTSVTPGRAIGHQGHADEGVAAGRGRARRQLVRDDYPALHPADADYSGVALVDKPGEVHDKLGDDGLGAFTATA